MNTNTNSNATKFSGKAEVYAASRPRYAAEALRYLSTQGLIPGSIVADIGSGTGIFSKQLLNLGAEVYAVEPNDEMRHKAETDLDHYQLFHSVNASAEHTALPAQSVDFITAAQAFHWFDANAFKTECRRILKPGGKVALLWNNGYGSLCPEYDKMTNRLVAQFRPESAVSELNQTETVITAIKNFFAQEETQKFANDISCNKKTFITNWCSKSYVPLPSNPRYETFIKQLEEIFDRFQENGVITTPTNTVVHIGKI